MAGMRYAIKYFLRFRISIWVNNKLSYAYTYGFPNRHLRRVLTMLPSLNKGEQYAFICNCKVVFTLEEKGTTLLISSRFKRH